MSRQKRPLEDRFWEKVDKTDGCWNWIACTSQGYGLFSISRSKARNAHRISWELAHGPITDGLFVCHHCDNRLCVKPDHLFLGTQRDNLTDMAIKHRGTTKNRGSGSGRTKLTEEDVKTIRLLSSKGISRAELGRKYGIAATSISRIVLRKRWLYEG